MGVGENQLWKGNVENISKYNMNLIKQQVNYILHNFICVYDYRNNQSATTCALNVPPNESTGRTSSIASNCPEVNRLPLIVKGKNVIVNYVYYS